MKNIAKYNIYIIIIYYIYYFLAYSDMVIIGIRAFNDYMRKRAKTTIIINANPRYYKKSNISVMYSRVINQLTWGNLTSAIAEYINVRKVNT